MNPTVGKLEDFRVKEMIDLLLWLVWLVTWLPAAAPHITSSWFSLIKSHSMCHLNICKENKDVYILNLRYHKCKEMSLWLSFFFKWESVYCFKELSKGWAKNAGPGHTDTHTHTTTHTETESGQQRGGAAALQTRPLWEVLVGKCVNQQGSLTLTHAHTPQCKQHLCVIF